MNQEYELRLTGFATTSFPRIRNTGSGCFTMDKLIRMSTVSGTWIEIHIHINQGNRDGVHTPA